MPLDEKSADRLLPYAEIERYARLWNFPELEEVVSLRFSARLTKTWARTNLSTNTITLASELRGDRERLNDVLCHELAHVVSHERVGRAEGPHGPTWRRLVLDGGGDPSVRLADRNAATTKADGVPRRFLHRCPVCDFSRIARRPIPAWRCADCVAAGLGGELIVTEPTRPT